MPRTLTDEDVEAIADAIERRRPRQSAHVISNYHRPAPCGILKGEDAAARMGCCWTTFRNRYVKTGRIKPIPAAAGKKQGRGFTSASVEALHRQVFGKG